MAAADTAPLALPALPELNTGQADEAIDGAWITLVRHGETEWNREWRIQGHTDIGLNDVGREQALALRSRLRPLLPAAIYCSDMSRTLETAHLALGLPQPDAIQQTQALRERCFGEWEGLTRQEIAERYPDLYPRWMSSGPGFVSPGAEPYPALRQRVGVFLDQVAARHQGGRVLLFTHGGTILTAICHALAMPPETRLRIRIFNTSITTLWWTGNDWKVAVVNDHCHTSGSQV